MMGAQFLGVSWKPATGQRQMVGFGPGSGTSIAGGAFANPGSDSFTNHPDDETISITQQSENGLLKGTLTSTAGTTPFVAVASQISGKWVLFGTAQDGANSQPWNIFLLEK
jgi:hypothetical protein